MVFKIIVFWLIFGIGVLIGKANVQHIVEPVVDSIVPDACLDAMEIGQAALRDAAIYPELIEKGVREGIRVDEKGIRQLFDTTEKVTERITNKMNRLSASYALCGRDLE